MDLDAPSSKRPRDTSSSTQPSDFVSPNEFAQRAQAASVPLPRTPDPVVPASESPFQAVPHGHVALATPPLSSRDEAMPSTQPFQCFPGRETAPVTPRVENSKRAESAPSFSVPVSHQMSKTSAVPSTLPADPVVHAATQNDESDQESAVDTQSDDPFQTDDTPMTALVILTTVMICRITSEPSFTRVEFASLLRVWNPMRNVCVWMLANDQF